MQLKASKKTLAHAFRDDALGDDDAVAISNKIKKGSISAVEAAESAVARANIINTHLNAVETEYYDLALAELKKSSRISKNPPLTYEHGFFSGVPTFIKDNMPIAGLPTNHGSMAVNSLPAKQHDPYAQQFLAQGFTCLGKSVMPEFGFNATTEHLEKEPTKNPWNLGYSCGASSGGAAALVASGVVPVAHANDGGGSIRIPAACCGLIGLKPSRGRHVLSKQSSQLPLNIVSEGIVSRSVRDTAYFHHEGEKYYRNHSLPPIGLVTSPSHRRLKIGMMIDSTSSYKTDSETRGSIESMAHLLQEMGHHVEECKLPIATDIFLEDFSLYWSFLALSVDLLGKYSVDKSFDRSKLNAFTKGLAGFFKSNFYKIPMFLYRLKKIQFDYSKCFNEYDIILTPVLSHTTPELGHLSPTIPFEILFKRLFNYVGFTPLANVSGGPAISLPSGIDQKGLPIGIQFSAFHGDERTLLEIAYEIEEARPWQKIQALSTSHKETEGFK